MSFMHIMGAIIIGAFVGRLFSLFTLKLIKWKKYVFMLSGAIGSILCDLIFKFLWEAELVSSFFYKHTTIIFEMIAGAFIACYILNLFGKSEKIDY